MPALAVRGCRLFFRCHRWPKGLSRADLLLLAAAFVLAPGCGNKEPRQPVFPVHGRVLFHGQPAANALVVFHPLTTDEKDPIRPRGQVQPDGTFTLSTYQSGDGAPAGDYRVTVELWLSSANADEGPSNRLPAKYANPQTSGLTARVEAGPTDLQPFQLKR
jgi:hypothetical protein